MPPKVDTATLHKASSFTADTLPSESGLFLFTHHHHANAGGTNNKLHVGGPTPFSSPLRLTTPSEVAHVLPRPISSLASRLRGTESPHLVFRTSTPSWSSSPSVLMGALKGGSGVGGSLDGLGIPAAVAAASATAALPGANNTTTTGGVDLSASVGFTNRRSSPPSVVAGTAPSLPTSPMHNLKHSASLDASALLHGSLVSTTPPPPPMMTSSQDDGGFGLASPLLRPGTTSPSRVVVSRTGSLPPGVAPAGKQQQQQASSQVHRRYAPSAHTAGFRDWALRTIAPHLGGGGASTPLLASPSSSTPPVRSITPQRSATEVPPPTSNSKFKSTMRRQMLERIRSLLLAPVTIITTENVSDQEPVHRAATLIHAAIDLKVRAEDALRSQNIIMPGTDSDQVPTFMSQEAATSWFTALTQRLAVTTPASSSLASVTASSATSSATAGATSDPTHSPSTAAGGATSPAAGQQQHSQQQQPHHHPPSAGPSKPSRGGSASSQKHHAAANSHHNSNTAGATTTHHTATGSSSTPSTPALLQGAGGALSTPGHHATTPLAAPLSIPPAGAAASSASATAAAPPPPATVRIQYVEGARHICVGYAGYFFSMEVIDPQGRHLVASEIAERLKAIMAMTQPTSSHFPLIRAQAGTDPLGMLRGISALPVKEFATLCGELRSACFANQDALTALDSCLLFVTLSDDGSLTGEDAVDALRGGPALQHASPAAAAEGLLPPRSVIAPFLPMRHGLGQLAVSAAATTSSSTTTDAHWLGAGVSILVHRNGNATFRIQAALCSAAAAAECVAWVSASASSDPMLGPPPAPGAMSVLGQRRTPAPGAAAASSHNAGGGTSGAPGSRSGTRTGAAAAGGGGANAAASPGKAPGGGSAASKAAAAAASASQLENAPPAVVAVALPPPQPASPPRPLPLWLPGNRAFALLQDPTSPYVSAWNALGGSSSSPSTTTPSTNGPGGNQTLPPLHMGTMPRETQSATTTTGSSGSRPPSRTLGAPTPPLSSTSSPALSHNIFYCHNEHVATAAQAASRSNIVLRSGKEHLLHIAATCALRFAFPAMGGQVFAHRSGRDACDPLLWLCSLEPAVMDALVRLQLLGGAGALKSESRTAVERAVAAITNTLQKDPPYVTDLFAAAQRQTSQTATATKTAAGSPTASSSSSVIQPAAVAHGELIRAAHVLSQHPGVVVSQNPLSSSSSAVGGSSASAAGSLSLTQRGTMTSLADFLTIQALPLAPGSIVVSYTAKPSTGGSHRAGRALGSLAHHTSLEFVVSASSEGLARRFCAATTRFVELLDELLCSGSATSSSMVTTQQQQQRHAVLSSSSHDKRALGLASVGSSLVIR